MKVLTLGYGRTLSDKDFGGFRVDISVEVQDGDIPQECMNKMKKFVLKNVNEDIFAAKEAKSQQELPMNTPPKKEVEAEEKKEAPKKEEKKEAPKKTAPKKEAKKEAKKAVKAKANVTYDRTLKPHKTMFLELATELGIRKDKSDESKAALKATSEFMEGQDMFEAGSTDILDLFSHNTKSFYEKQMEKESKEDDV